MLILYVSKDIRPISWQSRAVSIDGIVVFYKVVGLILMQYALSQSPECTIVGSDRRLYRIVAGTFKHGIQWDFLFMSSERQIW